MNNIKYIYHYIVLLILLINPSRVNAQSRCGTDEYINGMIAQYPFIQDDANEAAQKYKQYRTSGTATGSELITIPVVVHIIHNGESLGIGRNISDAQILSQIAILNQDFAFSNVRFCLAIKDPQGNPATGITRHYNSKQYFIPFDDNPTNPKPIDDPEIKSHGTWPYSQYLNIWVCDLRELNPNNTLYGYATFPWVTSVYDGVVIGYNYFGNIGTGLTDPNFNKGKTATHEVGHWLGLRHVFQGGCLNIDCDQDGDEVCDTDPVPSPAWAGVTPSSCSYRLNCDQQTISAENYMDYNYDQCASFFTQGQKERMHFMLQRYRANMYYYSIQNPQALPVECTAGSGGGGGGGGQCSKSLDVDKGFFLNQSFSTNVTSCSTDIVLSFAQNDTCIKIRKCVGYDCSHDPSCNELKQALDFCDCLDFHWGYFVSVYYNCDENYNCQNEIGKWYTVYEYYEDNWDAHNETYGAIELGFLHNFTFEKGKYYKIKLATNTECDYGWIESTKNLYILPEDNKVFTNTTIPSGTYAAKQTVFINNSTTAPGGYVKVEAGDYIEILQNSIINGNFFAYTKSFTSCPMYRLSPPAVPSNDNYTLSSEEQDSPEISSLFKKMSVYPNPSSGLFVIKYDFTHNTKIEIVNVTGKIVYSSQKIIPGTKELSLNLATESKGIYFIKVYDNDQQFVERIIIQ